MALSVFLVEDSHATVFPQLLNTQYSNILNTEFVHRLGSLPKIIKFKRCIQFDLIELLHKEGTPT